MKKSVAAFVLGLLFGYKMIEPGIHAFYIITMFMLSGIGFFIGYTINH